MVHKGVARGIFHDITEDFNTTSNSIIGAVGARDINDTFYRGIEIMIGG